jgi:serine phosphatase RsbU (regulator of sigma subunit)
VLTPGSALAVYTDGLTDPRNVDTEHSPLLRLTELLENPEVLPAEIVERLLDGLELRNAGRLRDDVTLLVVSRDLVVDPVDPVDAVDA